MPGLGHTKPTQEGQLQVLSSRKRARVFTETMGVVARLLCGVFCREERALGAPNSLVGVSARVPLFHMPLQVASSNALRVCAPRDPAGTLGDRPRGRAAVGWPLLIKEEVGGDSLHPGGGRSSTCHS